MIIIDLFHTWDCFQKDLSNQGVISIQRPYTLYSSHPPLLWLPAPAAQGMCIFVSLSISICEAWHLFQKLLTDKAEAAQPK